MLQVSSLTRRYGNFIAVNDASFAIDNREIVGLLGHNGAGKTTIMKMLSGYLEPDTGSVTINGIDIAKAPKVAQRDLGYLPENLPVYPEMLVADYLDYAAQLKGLDADKKRYEIKRAVKATDISEKFLDPIYTLSRGFKQRVGVAQAILGNPKLLILDEPTNGLDPTQTEHMRELIREIAKQATVILSTHIMQEVDAICDRVLILNHGRLAVDAKMEDLHRSNKMAVKCSLNSEALQSVLNNIEGIESTERVGEQDQESVVVHRYLLTLGEIESAEPLCAQIAKTIINAGGELFQLNLERRDLENLFKEANQTTAGEGGVGNAA